MATKTTEELLKESGAETATYIDEAGEKKTGTVLRGYINAEKDADYYGTQGDLYKGMLDEQQAANQAAADAANEETRINAQLQTEKINTGYGASDKELFRGYKKAVRDLPQQLAAMGATGGLSETSRVELETGYGENLNKSQLQRMAEIAELEAATAAAERQNAAAVQQQNASALQNYYNLIAGLGEQKYQEDRARDEQGAAALAQYGDYSGYVALGIMTEEQAALLRQAWIAENPSLARKLGYVKSSGGGGTRWYGVGGGDEIKESDLTPYELALKNMAIERQESSPDWLWEIPAAGEKKKSVEKVQKHLEQQAAKGR